MQNDLGEFERIVRAAHNHTEAAEVPGGDHPFDLKNIHADLPSEVRRLFDNGHYAQSTFEALKYVDEEVQRLAGSSDSGKSLMMAAFNENNPVIPLSGLASVSEKNEQEGYKFLFAGTIVGIRNPRGHNTGVTDDPDTCLDHLVVASMLLRRLDQTGLR